MWFKALKFCLFSIVCHSNTILKINEPLQKKSLHTIAKIHNASDSNLSVFQVSRLPNSSFKELTNESQDLGFTTNHFWVKFTIENPTNHVQNYFLETARPILDFAEFYTLNKNKIYYYQKSGDAIPFSERSIQNRKILFDIHLPPHAKFDYYLHFKSDGEVINIPLQLRSNINFIQNYSIEQIIFGLFYGILAITSVLYFFFYYTTKESVFFYYSLYVIAVGLLQFSLDGYFYEFIFPNANWISKNSVLVFAVLTLFFLGKYFEKYISIKKVKSKIASYFGIMYFILIIAFFSFLLNNPAVNSFGYPLINSLGLLFFFLILCALIEIYLTTKVVFPFFTIGILFLIAGFVIFILKNFGILPCNFITENGSKFGTCLETIFYSLTMAKLIGDLKDETIKSQKIALLKSEEISRLKSHFLSNISHELRTPLNTIMNVTEMIPHENNPHEIQEKCDVIKLSSQNLLCSINDILDFSKIDNNEFDFDTTSINIKNISDTIAKYYTLKSSEKGLKFLYHFDQKIPELVLADANRIEQVFNNLLLNALKFTNYGEINFQLKLVEQIKNKATIKIIVSDTGIGMDKKNYDTIFESFSQEHATDKRRYGGLGLGLYIVQKIVQKYNGSISIQTEVKKGSKFSITIQLPISKKKNISPFSLSNFSFLKKSILIVEDNVMNQMVLKMFFKSYENIKLKIANNGHEALEILKEMKFDIILMDLQMPVMDGYEATKAIRNGTCGVDKKATPIIAITADTTDTARKKTIELGMNFYMTKPVKKDDLLIKIMELTKTSTV